MIFSSHVETRMVLNCTFCGSNKFIKADNTLVAAMDFQEAGWTTKSNGMVLGPCCPKCAQSEPDLEEVTQYVPTTRMVSVSEEGEEIYGHRVPTTEAGESIQRDT